MEVRSERLVLREFVADDLPGILTYHADPRYAEFVGPTETTPEHTRELLRTFMRWVEDVPRRNYQLVIAESGCPEQPIGTCGIRRLRDRDDIGEFGIELAPGFWGLGLAAEASGCVLRVGFQGLGWREIRSISVTENQRAGRLVTRLGFAPRGRVDGPAWLRDRGWSLTSWSLSVDAWTARSKE